MSIIVELADGQDPEEWVDRIAALCKHRRHWWQFWRSKKCAIVSVATVTPDEFTQSGGVAFGDLLDATRFMMESVQRSIGERVAQRAALPQRVVDLDGPKRPWQVSTIERIANTEPKPSINDPVSKYLPRSLVRYMEDARLALVYLTDEDRYKVVGRL